jgi:iron(III) transport system substrate-binding protein
MSRRRHLWRSAGVIAAALLLSIFAAGCGRSSSGTTSSSSVAGSWDQIVAAANKEGKVNWYTSGLTVQQATTFTKAFDKLYPKIHLNIVTGEPNALIKTAQLQIQSGHGSVGVIAPSAPQSYFTGQSGDWIRIAQLPSFQQGYKASEWYHGTYMVMDATPFVFAWNTKIVPGGLSNVNQLLQPALHGKIGVQVPNYSAAVAQYLYLINTYGKSWLQKIADNGVVYYAAGALPSFEALGSGELGALIYATPSGLQSLMAAGAPIKVATLGEKFAYPLYGAIPKSAPDPDAAMVLMNFMSSSAGDAVRTPMTVSLLPTTKGKLGYLGDYNVTLIDQATTQVMKNFQSEWNGIFHR